MRIECSEHSSQAEGKTATNNDPWVGAHQPETPSAPMQRGCCYPDDTDTQAGVEEGLVEVGAFVGWHATILPCFAIEYEISCENGATYDGSTI